MKNPLRKPKILTVDQLKAVLEAHQRCGSHTLKGIYYVVCSCERPFPGYTDAHVRHQAEEIAKLQV